MGTRSTVHFQKDGKTVASVYQQFDGYPEGVGTQVADLLTAIKMVNGIPMGENGVRFANGVGCLAAQYIADYKDGPGNLYMTDENDRQEYDYFINYKTDDVYDYHPDPVITVLDWSDGILYTGGLDGFVEFCGQSC